MCKFDRLGSQGLEQSFKLLKVKQLVRKEWGLNSRSFDFYAKDFSLLPGLDRSSASRGFGVHIAFYNSKTLL